MSKLPPTQEIIILLAVALGAATGFVFRWIGRGFKRLFSRKERELDYMLAIALFLAFAAFILFISTL